MLPIHTTAIYCYWLYMLLKEQQHRRHSIFHSVGVGGKGAVAYLSSCNVRFQWHDNLHPLLQQFLFLLLPFSLFLVHPEWKRKKNHKACEFIHGWTHSMQYKNWATMMIIMRNTSSFLNFAFVLWHGKSCCKLPVCTYLLAKLLENTS